MVFVDVKLVLVSVAEVVVVDETKVVVADEVVMMVVFTPHLRSGHSDSLTTQPVQ